MTKEKFKLLGNNILVRIKQIDDKPGGIIVPDSAKKGHPRGTIIAIGTFETLAGAEKQIHVKVGDEVILGTSTGTKVYLNEEELLLLNIAQVIAIMGRE